MNLINSKKEIIRCIHEQDQQAEAWIDSVPMSIRDAFFDNPYVSARGRIIAYLMMYVFNEEEREWADWLLLEWTYNPELTINIDGISYRFNSFDEGLDKLFELGLIKEDRKMNEDTRVWVDPPSGWKYGFPKVYDPTTDNPNVVEWIIDNGYPRKLMESFKDHFHYRTWEAKE